ncbi:MAG: uracil phosphoribosyltransferase [Deltaproteobacteria bacterium]|nr:uracil phosphoribosyltransferase [Deltaproteobacteria bacterium]
MRHPMELEHCYGENVHIFNDPLAHSLLAKLCSPKTKQPTINRLVSTLYRQMICAVITREMPTTQVEVPTRMVETNPEAIWRGKIIEPQLSVAVVCVARAGIFPSQVSYDFLNEILDPEYVRQDHMLMNRTTDEDGVVNGAAIHGAKIGGSVEGRTMLIPDPMGATGTTVLTLLDHYENQVPGTPSRVIALNLIITPEYVRRIRERAPNVHIYSYRLDRGLSPQDVLDAIPGEHWDRERGLNDNGYIIPGGGGFGEIMNNAFV